MIDIKKAKEEAEKEFFDEKLKEAKTKIKSQLKRVADARRILANEERVLQDLYAELGSE
jgi:hypothetical protein